MSGSEASSAAADLLTLAAAKDVVPAPEVATSLRWGGKDGTFCERLPAAVVA